MGEGLIDYLGWHEITPQRLREKIFSTLDRKDEYTATMANFQLTGITTMLQRLTHFRNQSSVRPAAPTPETATIQP